MYILNGRLIFTKTKFTDDWLDSDNVKNAVGSVILCPATVQELKRRWWFIKASGEPYSEQILNEIAGYKDFHFYVPEERYVKSCDWLPCFDYLEHEYDAVVEMLNRRRLAIFFDTGTGKTIITVQYLYNKLKNQTGRNALVITKSIVVSQFANTIAKLPEEILKNNNIKVVSYDTAYKLQDTKFDIIFLDESHLVKNSGTRRFEDMLTVIKPRTPYVFLLTATPQDRTKFETIVQLSLLSEKVLSRRGVTAFKTRYWELDEYNNPKKEYKDKIHEINLTLNQMSIACITDEVIDIPPWEQPTIVDCYHGKDMTLFNIMRNPKKRIINVDGIDFVGDSAGKQRSILKTISNGFLYETTLANPDDDIEEWKTTKIVHHINTNKIDEMRNVFLKEKFDCSVIFTFFDEDNRMVASLMNELGLKYKSILKSTQAQRNQIVLDFKTGKFDVLIVKYTSGGSGLDLERSNNIHWFTPPEGWIDLKQGRGRVHRYGQKRKQKEFVYLGSPLDADIFNTTSVLKKNYNDETFEHFVHFI